MSRRTRWLVFVIVFVFMAGGGYAASLFLGRAGVIPKEFTDARSQGAMIAQNIVDLSKQSTADLAKVNDFDAKGDYTDALTLTTNMIEQSQQIRDQAVQLSSQVETMTRSLSNIGSLDARQAALESIASRLALISRLINYSGYLGQLLDTLRSHFTGNPPQGHDVATLIDQINSEVNAINNFNNQATQSMMKFDKITQ